MSDCGLIIPYVATVAAGTAVTHCVSAQLGARRDRRALVVCRGNRLEVYSHTADGDLRAVARCAMYGRVGALRSFRPQGGSDRDALLIVTEGTRRFAVLALSADESCLATVASGDLSEFVAASPEEPEVLATVDARGRLAGCVVYEGLFKAFALGDGGVPAEAPWSARLVEIRVVDVAVAVAAATNNNSALLLLVLHDDLNGRRQVTSYKIADRELHAGPFTLADLDGATAKLAVQPSGALFAFGERELAFFDPAKATASPATFARVAVPARTTIVAVADFDAKRGKFLALDMMDDALTKVSGRIYCTTAPRPGAANTRPSMEVVGVGSRGACGIAYLGGPSRAAFVGSAVGDSELVEVRDDGSRGARRAALGPNWGPIVDMCVVDPPDRRGQARLVACCGLGSRGCLRVIRDGVGVRPVNRAPFLDGGGGGGHALQRVWTVAAADWGTNYSSNNSKNNNNNNKKCVVLVLGFSRATSACFYDGDDDAFAPTPRSPLRSDERTLDVAGGGAVCAQVTPSGVLRFAAADFFEETSMMVANAFKEAAAGGRYTLAASSPPPRRSSTTNASSTLVVATTEGHLTVLDLAGGAFFRENRDVPLRGGECAALAIDATHLAVATWATNEVHVLSKKEEHFNEAKASSSFKPWATIDATRLGAAPRALALFDEDEEGMKHVAVALTDGLVTVFAVSDDHHQGAVARHTVSVGTRPARLFPGPTQGSLFAAAERACLIQVITAEPPDSTSSRRRTYPPSAQPVPAAPKKVVSLAAHLDDAGAAIDGSDDSDEFWATCALATTTVEGGSVVFVGTSREVLACTVDADRDLRSRAIPLKEQPRCVAHDASMRLLCCGTTAADDDDDDDDDENNNKTVGDKGARIGAVRFFRDTEPFDEVFAFQLASMERPQCCTSLARFGPAGGGGTHNATPPRPCFVVGTAIATPADFEPTAGRLLVFGLDDFKEPRRDNDEAPPPTRTALVALEATVELQGAAYDVCGGLTVAPDEEAIVVAVNQNVCIFRRTSPSTVDLVASYDGMIVALKVRAFPSTTTAALGKTTTKKMNDLVAVGDLMRSATVLRFDAGKGILVEVARDYNAHWTTALAVLGMPATSNAMVLVAEGAQNLVALRIKPSPLDGDDARCLETVGEFHLGDTVNRFEAGALASAAADVAHQEDGGATLLLAQPPTLFATVSGMIGAVLALPDHRPPPFGTAAPGSVSPRALGRLERALVDAAARDAPPFQATTVGAFDYDAWRAFKSPRKTAPRARGFLDGDLLQTFLDIDPSAQRAVVDAIRFDDDDDQSDDQHVPSVDAFRRHLEDLRRLH